jgi:antitoxin VapB
VAFHVRDEETDAAVRRLAKRKGKTLTATIREACEHEYEREYGGDNAERRDDEFMDAVRAAQAAFKAISRPGGLPADKAFYDELSGEDELAGPL